VVFSHYRVLCTASDLDCSCSKFREVRFSCCRSSSHSSSSVNLSGDCVSLASSFKPSKGRLSVDVNRSLGTTAMFRILYNYRRQYAHFVTRALCLYANMLLFQGAEITLRCSTAQKQIKSFVFPFRWQARHWYWQPRVEGFRKFFNHGLHRCESPEGSVLVGNSLFYWTVWLFTLALYT
jgi:hypothetical protein